MNPIIVRMSVLLVAAIAAFGLAMYVIRRLRKSLAAEGESITQSPLAAEGLPVHAFHAVIQQLKQQKHELATQQLAVRRKAKASDTLSATVLANLSSGVLFLNTTLLVRQANAAARNLLGFASPIGLPLADLFRMATLRASNGLAVGTTVEQALAPALSGKSGVHGLLLNHVTRDGESRALEVTASPVMAEDGTRMGVTLVLNDKTDIERIRHAQRVQQEVSAELGMGLRDSLSTIAGYAQQLSSNGDPERVRELAGNIASEAARLDRTIGSFLGSAQVASPGA
jgi:nitrogen-specific signal transduction histidine kinase